MGRAKVYAVLSLSWNTTFKFFQISFTKRIVLLFFKILFLNALLIRDCKYAKKVEFQ